MKLPLQFRHYLAFALLLLLALAVRFNATTSSSPDGAALPAASAPVQLASAR